jgi:hypothetical protein
MVQVIGKASVAGGEGVRSGDKVEFGCGIGNITALSYNKPILGVVGKALQMRTTVEAPASIKAES